MAAEVAVVGAGVNGLAAAHALAREGRDVVVYEQFELAHTRGSSHGRSRIFRLAYPEAKWVDLAVEALDGWRALEAESGEELIMLNGLLELVRDPAQSSKAALDECGVECELLGGEDAERRFGVSAADGASVLFQPDSGIVYADRRAARSRRAFGSRRATESSRWTTSASGSWSSPRGRGHAGCLEARGSSCRSSRHARRLPTSGSTARSRRWSPRS